MKTTVTDGGASVASTTSIEEALESGFLPTDPHYRKTGRFSTEETPGRAATETEEKSGTDTEVEQEEHPQEQDEQEEHPQEQDEQDPAASGEQDGETAAASQAASTQNEKKPQTRTREQSESRWAKITRENRELRDRLARLEGRQEAAGTARDTSQTSQSAAAQASTASPRPKIDDVDPKTGQPKYASYSDYEAARDEWLQNEAIRKFQETTSKTERERQQREAAETISREWNKRIVEAEKELPDFREVALNPDLTIKAGSVVDVFILDSPVGAKVLYHLGKNPAELDRINALNPIAQARELTKIELKVSGSAGSSSSARSVSQAPRPPHQVSGKGTVTKDAVEEAIEKQDVQTYMREQNQRDSRLHAVRRTRGK